MQTIAVHASVELTLQTGYKHVYNSKTHVYNTRHIPQA